MPLHLHRSHISRGRIDHDHIIEQLPPWKGHHLLGYRQGAVPNVSEACVRFVADTVQPRAPR